MVHLLQIDSDHKHVHGDKNVELSHAICVQGTSEEQIQKEFDSADTDMVGWNIAAVETRHHICYRPPPKDHKGPKPNQLSLTLLRSCRQIYLEANKVPYTNNTFGVYCHDVLERFVKARYPNDQHLAIRSLYLEVSITHASSIYAWSDTISKTVLRRLRTVRCLYLTLTQIYCICSVENCGYEGSEMTRRQGMMFKKLAKLPLKVVTLVVDDSGFLMWAELEEAPDRYEELEQNRWTMKQKQDFSKEVRGALLG